jgi:hypothetical protein
MAQYAAISSGFVVNIIEWDGAAAYDPPDGLTHDLIPDGDAVAIGYTWTNGVFTAPPIIAPTENYIAKVNFYSLFTANELVMFNAVRKQIAALQPADYQAVGGGTGTATQQGLVEFEAFLTILDAADQVNLLDARMPLGLGLCVSLGILAAQDRVTAILANQVVT